MKKILNITNGDYFNSYFLEKFGGEAIPFRENMMDGEAFPNIFSEEFICIRSKALGVSADEYRKNTPLLETDLESFDGVALWFGKDTFCQMNLITLLAYLEEKEYKKEISLNYIDDETFEIIEKNIAVSLGCYKKLYEEILISKNKPSSNGVLVEKAVDLYFDYLSEDGALARLVRESREKSNTEILTLLLKSSAEYGLSDVQAQEIIKNNKQTL